MKEKRDLTKDMDSYKRDKYIRERVSNERDGFMRNRRVHAKEMGRDFKRKGGLHTKEIGKGSNDRESLLVNEGKDFKRKRRVHAKERSSYERNGKGLQTKEGGFRHTSDK